METDTPPSADPATSPAVLVAQERNRRLWLEIAEADRARCAARAVLSDRIREALSELEAELGRQEIALVLRALAREAA